MITLNSVLFMIFLNTTTAHAAYVCDKCAQMEQLAPRVAKNEFDAIRAGTDLLSQYQLSADAKQRAAEISSVVKLSVQLIQAESIGDAESYFFQLYRQYPTEFDREINRLDAKTQKIARDVLKSTEEVFKKGNGAPSPSKKKQGQIRTQKSSSHVMLHVAHRSGIKKG